MNPRYSLRAFARTLGVESSALSKIISGKRSITRTMLKRLACNLALSPEAIGRFESAITGKRGRNSTDEGLFKPLETDQFQVISDWYHYAILELVTVKDFEPSARWIANALGISVAEANDAIERLVRLNFLDINGRRWRDRSGDVTCIISPEFTTSAHKKLQAQILEKGITAIEEVPVAERSNTAMTMAIDPALLPEARKVIQKFRRQLCALLQKSPRKTEVYHLGIALYPVTKKRREGDER